MNNRRNKRKVKFLSTVIIMSLCFCMIVTQTNAKYFSDVPTSNEFLKSINYVSDNGYMNGTTTTEFSPSSIITRAAFITVLYRYAGEPAVTGTLQFSDVSTTASYYNAVYWGVQNGYINGTSDVEIYSVNEMIIGDCSVDVMEVNGKTVCSLS